jgi:hypothetical protein
MHGAKNISGARYSAPGLLMVDTPDIMRSDDFFSFQMTSFPYGIATLLMLEKEYY